MSKQTLSLKPQTATANLTPAPSGILQRQCACGNHTVAGGECAECAKNKSGLQRKLAIGASNDPLEQEADRVADQVLAAPAQSAVSSGPPRIQRFTGQATAGMATAPASVDRVLAGSGRPLDAVLRKDMEQRFSHDFSRVRVHSDAAAGQSAQDVSANAYTVGNDIVFGEGRFAPGTHEGRRLIAHELTHVTQQSWSASEATARYMTAYPRALPQVTLPSVSSLTVGPPDDQFEQDADQVADAVGNSGYTRGRQFGFLNTQAGSNVIRRQETVARPTREEQRGRQLRQLARFPRRALEQWKTLRVKERDGILREMTRDYGEDFTNDFTEYAFGIKRPNLSGTFLQSTPKELIAKGYLYTGSGDVWVHPSGHEIFLLSPPKPEPSPTGDGDTENEDDEILSKCKDLCWDKTETTDECNECCEKLSSEDEICRSACKSP